MKNAKSARALGAVIMAAICILAPACGEHRNSDDPAKATPSQAATNNAQTVVVFHMTGLLLIVPPQTPGTPTHVLLPPEADHVAWLGFGFDGPTPSVCDTNPGDPSDTSPKTVYAREAAAKGICYVNLEVWKLQTFGANGEPSPTNLPFPSSIVNVTRVTGGHKVDFSTPLPEVTFSTGWLGPTSCSLADWTYVPKNAGGGNAAEELRPLANVVDWEIVHPTAKLVFEPVAGGQQIPIDLPKPDANNRIELLLAHVLKDDLKNLPPQPGTLEPTTPLPTAKHFEEYYKHLASQGGQTAPHVIPQFRTGTAAHACLVGITLVGKRLLPEGERAVGTYACMPTTGDGP